MMRSVFIAASAAALLAGAPVSAKDKVGEIVGGIAKQYLEQEQDKAAFARAQSVNTLAAYQSYLQQFPNGAYASHARAQVERLGGKTTADPGKGDKPVVVAPPGSAQSGAGANLTAQQRVSIQQRLTALGYDTAGTDGSFGPGTRRAIALWQRDRNYDQTGTLTAAQATEILRGTRGTTAGSATTPSTGPAQVEAALGLTRAQKAAVQAGLTRRGFDTRGADGAFGRATRSAITGWQRANDMTATGYLTAAQVEHLMK